MLVIKIAATLGALALVAIIHLQARRLHRRDMQLRAIDRAVDAMPPEGQLYVRQHLDEALARAGVPR